MTSQAWFQSLVVSSSGRIMAGGGAVPIVEGGNVIGAIGVAVGPTSRTSAAATRLEELSLTDRYSVRLSVSEARKQTHIIGANLA